MRPANEGGSRAVRARVWLALALLAWSALAFLGGLAAAHTGLIQRLGRALQPRAKTPTPLYTLEQTTAPVLEISLTEEGYQQLARNREQILGSGKVLITEPTVVISATVRLDQGTPLPATVRLKGTQVTHLRDPRKWSLRIDIAGHGAGDGALLDMQHFSIHHPKERNYLDEWYYLSALGQEGLIGLRYDYVRVKLHGEDLGIYAVEELPEPRLLARSGRPDGALLRFDQTALLKEWVTFGDALKQGGGTGSGTLAASPIVPFDADAVLSGPAEDTATFAAGARLLEAFRRGDVGASQTFDVPLMARFLALTDLFGSWHGLNWNNLRFYYNPETERLEPIGYDTNAGADISKVGLIGQGIQQFEFQDSAALLDRLIADRGLSRAYVQELERLSDPAWQQAFFAGLHEQTLRNYSLLYAEFPDADYTISVYARNAEYIRKVLDPNTAGVEAYVLGYTAAAEGGRGGTLTLTVGNLQTLPVEPLGLSYGGHALQPVPTFAQVVLPARRGQVQYTPITYYWPDTLAWTETAVQQLTFSYHLLGTGETNRHEVNVSPWPFPLTTQTPSD